MMDLKEQLKDYALERLDMSVVGVTDVDRLCGAPEGHRPVDILPGARSVIVMGVRLSWGAIQAIYRAHEEGKRELQSIYGTHGYALTPNYHLYFAAYKMAGFLERHGFVSAPLQSGPGGGGAPFSHRHAAVAAGLGEFGWSGLVLSPDYGPRIRWVSVITRAALEPDPLYAGPRLCDRSRCRICVDVCPVGALSATKSRQLEIGGQAFEYAAVNTVKCRISCEGLTTKSLGLEDVPMPRSATWADVDKARDAHGLRPGPRNIHQVDMYYCGRCLAYCPVGNEEELRLSSGLSSVAETGDYRNIGRDWRAEAAKERASRRAPLWDAKEE